MLKAMADDSSAKSFSKYQRLLTNCNRLILAGRLTMLVTAW